MSMVSIPREDVGRLLVAEDDQNVRRVIVAHLQRAGFEVFEAASLPAAQQVLSSTPIDVVLTDLKMSDSARDGLELLEWVQKRPAPVPPVIVMTAFGTADIALEALDKGAYNLISKPCDYKELIAQLQQALASRAPRAEDPPQELPTGRFGIIGRTPALEKVFNTIARVADAPTTVLITGESGTGKELVARALHQTSVRAAHPFVTVNCAAIPDNLLESELFGHERGAFTGAVQSRAGKFELAQKGTLFLDEIGEMKPELQVKLLRCLQEREIQRVGGTDVIKIDVRVVAASNRELSTMVREGQFREDLFYRLSVVPIRLPALRERRDDIPLLIEHFIQRSNPRLDRRVTGIDRTALEALGRYSWPGNIRELENCVEQMMLFSESGMLGIRHLPRELLGQLRRDAQEGASREPEEHSSRPAPASAHQPTRDDLKKQRAEVERQGIIQALVANQWNVTQTARSLGYSRKGLQVKMKDLQIQRPGGSS